MDWTAPANPIDQAAQLSRRIGNRNNALEGTSSSIDSGRSHGSIMPETSVKYIKTRPKVMSTPKTTLHSMRSRIVNEGCGNETSFFTAESSTDDRRLILSRINRSKTKLMNGGIRLSTN